jgi:hypothetical protein
MIIDSNTFGTFLHVSKNDMKCLFYEIFNQDGIFFSEKSHFDYDYFMYYSIYNFIFCVKKFLFVHNTH